MRKLLLFSLLFMVSMTSISYAVNKFNYESALQIANEYIFNSSFDENWKETNPKILEKGKSYYTDSDMTISYIEFKVSCDNNPNCWFIMVNFDWDDVTIPVASTSWNTPSEILVAQNWGTVDDNKLYYFSPFEQYWINEKSWEVSSIDPVDNIDQELAQEPKLTKEEKKEKRKKSKTELKNRIINAKKEANEFKKTEDFKSKKKELREKKQSIPSDEFSYKILPFAENVNAADDILNQNWYTPIIASDTFVPWSTTWTCWSRVPCYKQFSTIYKLKTCSVWCAPVAVWMIYWYYDRQWTYPNLVSWTANYINDSTTNTMIKTLWDKMLTFCSWTQWETYSSNNTLSIQYAKDKWYANSVAKYITWTSTALFTTIKTEINAWRPVLLNTDNHSIVVYWYNKSFTTANLIRVNLWWGPNSTIKWVDWKYYSLSSIDYNINYIYYNSANHIAKSIVTFKIAQ